MRNTAFMITARNAACLLGSGPALALVACSPETEAGGQMSAPADVAGQTGSVPADAVAGDIAMTDKVDEKLRTALEAGTDDAPVRERVIITLKPDADGAQVASAEGVEVINRMQALPMIVAVIDAKGLKALADDPAVARIEADGEMRALPE